MPDSTTTTQTGHAPEQEHGFDLLAFWLLHKNVILLCAAGLAAILVVGGSAAAISHQREASAARMFAEAKGPSEMEGLLQKFPKSAAAANALLVIAADHRNNQRYDSSLQALDEFAKRFPEHPFAAGTLLSRGATLEAAGRKDEALAAYEDAAAKAGSYAAPVARLARASLLQSMGKTQEARQACEDLVAQDPASAFSGEAQRMLQVLQRM
jgi:tetratricopeptide (TPR) repeat protein